jgi:hypothetical protein
VPCLVPVPFCAVSNALTMPCRAVPNFLKAGHDTVKTRAQNSTVPVPVPYFNPFHLQLCLYRSVPFPATACLNLEHNLSSIYLKRLNCSTIYIESITIITESTFSLIFTNSYKLWGARSDTPFFALRKITYES